MTAVVGLALSGTVYLVMDQRVDDLEEELAGAESRTGLGGLVDLMEEYGLDELLGEDFEGFEREGLDLDDPDLENEMGVDPSVLDCIGLDMMSEGGGSIPDAEIETQVEAVRDIVESERGLAADGDLDIEFVTMDEVQQRVVDLSEQDLDREAIAVESRMLAALGAIDPGLDLVQAQLDALGDGVAGYYSPETEELVIGSEEMDAMGTYVTAHEMVHALADATFGLPDLESLAESDGGDAAFAALSALEGDATLYGQMMITKHLSFTDLLALEVESAGTSADLEALPHFVERSLSFPYLEGMAFTCDVFLDGDWASVDDTYADLPTTSAQILFPERYALGEEAEEVRALAGPDGWDEIHHDTFGAADLLFLLEAPGGDTDRALDDALDGAAAWAGGEVTVWDQDGDTAVGLVLAEHTDGIWLCGAVEEYYAAAFPDAERSFPDDGSLVFEGTDQSAVVMCDDTEETALGIGGDLETAYAAVDGSPQAGTST
ncbi:hypothetical protein [Phytoactinopolyspora endophytica]|uniref:hypothetical protein n=1 Tax=Phytoactinopolyspora endophytica TaxID=1642495 RepID=UPI0013EB3195|nr:hypothetical protein [Phytoactinopolyspora endophytica]